MFQIINAGTYAIVEKDRNRYVRLGQRWFHVLNDTLYPLDIRDLIDELEHDFKRISESQHSPIPRTSGKNSDTIRKEVQDRDSKGSESVPDTNTKKPRKRTPTSTKGDVTE